MLLASCKKDACMRAGVMIDEKMSIHVYSPFPVQRAVRPEPWMPPFTSSRAHMCMHAFVQQHELLLNLFLEDS